MSEETVEQVEAFSPDTVLCRGCGRQLPATTEYFNRDTRRSSRANGLNRRCKECTRKYAREYFHKNKERRSHLNRQDHLRTRYGIDLNDFNFLLAEQGGCCAICGSDSPGTNSQWHVDHDHRTGVVRGVLCRFCNQGLGHFNDDTDVLETAIVYLNSLS